jgi:hypothetical protein
MVIGDSIQDTWYKNEVQPRHQKESIHTALHIFGRYFEFEIQVVPNTP